MTSHCIRPWLIGSGYFWSQHKYTHTSVEGWDSSVYVNITCEISTHVHITCEISTHVHITCEISTHVNITCEISTHVHLSRYTHDSRFSKKKIEKRSLYRFTDDGRRLSSISRYADDYWISNLLTVSRSRVFQRIFPRLVVCSIVSHFFFEAVCVYMWVYRYTYTHMYTCIYIHAYTYIHVYAYTCIHVYAYTYIHVYIQIDLCTFIYV